MVKITIKDKKTGFQKEVAIKRTLSGDFILNEHPDLDIIVLPQKFKILALPKEDQSNHVYYLQDKLFNFLSKKGVILPESIVSGNIYGSLEAKYPEESPGGEDVFQVVVYNIANFIEDERPIVASEKDFEDNMEKNLLEPSVEDSTELEEVPHEEFKGSIPKYGFPTRGIYRYNY